MHCLPVGLHADPFHLAKGGPASVIHQTPQTWNYQDNQSIRTCILNNSRIINLYLRLWREDEPECTLWPWASRLCSSHPAGPRGGGGSWPPAAQWRRGPTCTYRQGKGSLSTMAGQDHLVQWQVRVIGYNGKAGSLVTMVRQGYWVQW